MTSALRAVILIVVGIAAYGLYEYAMFTPSRFFQRLVRSDTKAADRLNTDITADDTGAVIDEAGRTRRLDTRKLRDAIIPGALRAGDITGIYKEANALAEGGALPPEERTYEPYRPKPLAPVIDRLQTYLAAEDTFVEARIPGWAKFPTPIPVYGPVRIRAYGTAVHYEVPVGSNQTRVTATSGPSGTGLPDEHKPPFVMFATKAPFLALLGRVCTERPASVTGGLILNAPDRSCSRPFVVAEGGVLCPSEIGHSGELQLMVNTALLDGRSTVVDDTFYQWGGYWFDISVAPTDACAASPVRNLAREAAALADAKLLRAPPQRVLASQDYWKPFDLPASGKPFRVKASGNIQDYQASRDISGPDGIEAYFREQHRTLLPDANDTHKRFPALPFRVFVGRLCDSKSCGEPFAIGSERTVCPSASDERIELWINDNGVNRDRIGAYRFEMNLAADAKCG